MDFLRLSSRVDAIWARYKNMQRVTKEITSVISSIITECAAKGLVENFDQISSKLDQISSKLDRIEMCFEMCFEPNVMSLLPHSEPVGHMSRQVITEESIQV